MSEPPPPIPPAPAPIPPTVPGPVRPPERGDPLETYNTVAETVGMMPSLRWKDNLIQTVVILGSAGIGAAVGYTINGGIGAAAGGIGGLILSFFLSGLVLMILGWIRAARKRKG